MAEQQNNQKSNQQGGQRGGQQGGRRDGRRGNFEPVEKQFDERVIHIDRVARVVKGGRRFRFRALVVVGDNKGKVGVGVSKGVDVTSAVGKATEVAKKNFMNVVMEKDSIPHDVQAKVGGADILIKPAPKGSGLIAGGVVRTILEVTGIHNAVSKSLGSSSKINTSYAVLEALGQLQASKNWRTTKIKQAAKAANKSAAAKVPTPASSPVAEKPPKAATKATPKKKETK